MATPAGGAGAGGLVKRTPEQVQAQNLMILQRKDEAVSEILATATYVVIYVFEPKGKQWERKEIEGSLFIVKRSFGVRFRLVVLNRINPTDLEQDLTGSFTFEDMSPYLIYRTNADGEGGKGSGKVETLAIWFHNEKDKGNIAACLRKVLRLQAGSTDQQQQAERQEQTHQALLEPSSMLPAAPSPQTEQQQQQPGGAGASADKKLSIEEMLLKAARVSSSPSAGPQASPPPPGVMDLLLKPQTLAKPPADATKGLLNPMALAAAAAGGGGKGKANGSASAGLVLDKAQFKAALLSLLEEDDTFVDSLHRAYLKKAAGGGHTG